MGQFWVAVNNWIVYINAPRVVGEGDAVGADFERLYTTRQFRPLCFCSQATLSILSFRSESISEGVKRYELIEVFGFVRSEGVGADVELPLDGVAELVSDGAERFMLDHIVIRCYSSPLDIRIPTIYCGFVDTSGDGS